MFIYLFSLFVLFNNFRFKIKILNSNNNITIYGKKIKKITQNNIKKITQNDINIISGGDNRNLTISYIDNRNLTLPYIDNINLTLPDIDIKNLIILFEKYELLKKIKNNEYQNLKINIINISNGRLLEDWNFNF